MDKRKNLKVGDTAVTSEDLAGDGPWVGKRSLIEEGTEVMVMVVYHHGNGDVAYLMRTTTEPTRDCVAYWSELEEMD